MSLPSVELRGITAFRTIEDDPYREVVRELLEAMLDSGGHEQQVARREGMALRAVHELAAARHDHVDLVAGVRLLRIGAARRVELDAQRSALEGDREALARGAG